MRSAHLAAKFNIPFEIRSSIHLDREGTLISGAEKVESPVFEAISDRKNMTQLDISVSAQNANVGYAFAVDWLWQHGDAPQFCQVRRQGTSHSLSLLMKSELSSDFTEEFCKTFSSSKVLYTNSGLGTISLVGHGFQQSPESVKTVSELIPVNALAFEATNTLIATCVNESELTATVATLHKHLFEKPV